MVKKRAITTTFLSPNNGRKFRKTEVPLHFQHDFATNPSSSSDEAFVHTHQACDILSSGSSLTNDLTTATANTNGRSSRYQKAKTSQMENWTFLRTKLASAFFQSLAPEELCDVCGKELDMIFRCDDCAPRTILCSECVRIVHHHQLFHVVYMWKELAWVPYHLDRPIIQSAEHRNCLHTYNKKLIVVDSKGRHHTAVFQFCPCEEEPATLIRHFLWPASPKNPKICFHFHIMEMLRVLYLQVPVPVRDFCEALKFIRHPYVVMDDPLLQDIYKVLVNEAFEEYRYFMFQLEASANTCTSQGLNRGLKCPACPQEDEYPRIISMDANFGLVRKKSSGQSVVGPKHQGLYFIDQAGVDKFVSENSVSQPSKDQDCNEFKAGNTIRSKGRHHKLDETAVFGAACRHDFPQMMFSLKHGERLAYPVYLIRQLRAEYGSSNVHFMYDIACMLDSHIKKHHSDIPVDSLNLAIPIFHCYGHKLDCQVLYNPRKKAGFGLTDGECLERLWSYLRNFSKITKEMTPSHRVDTLTDALLHYANRNHLKIGSYLCAKMQKAKDLAAAAEKELSLLLSNSVTIDDVKQWTVVERNSVIKTIGIEEGKSVGEKLMRLLHKQCTERKILLEMMKKYAVGQAIAIRLERNVKKTTKEIRRLLSLLKEKAILDLSFQQAVEFQFFTDSGASKHRKAADMMNLKERAEEEIDLLSKEVNTVAKNFSQSHRELLSKVESDSPSSKEDLGQRSFLIARIVQIERHYRIFKEACKVHFDLETNLVSFTEKLQCDSPNVTDVFSDEELDEFVEDANTVEAELEVASEDESDQQVIDSEDENDA